MRPRWLVLGILGAFAAAGGAYTWWNWSVVGDRTRRADELLERAREYIAEALRTEDRAAGRDLLANAVRLASEAEHLSDAVAFEAMTIQAEALLRNTRAREAADLMSKALQRRPHDAHALELAAAAYHACYRVGKRESDFGSGIDLYDRAIAQEETPQRLLGAASLAEDKGAIVAADRYLQRLEQIAPGSLEAEQGRAMAAARGGPAGK